MSKSYRVIKTTCQFKLDDDTNTPLACELGTVNESNTFQIFLPGAQARFTFKRQDIYNLLGDEDYHD
ncbi:MAG: hypothetical protein RSA63_08770 [Eubacterium sp.]